MLTFWSETPGRRRREVAADAATWMWVAFWSVVAFGIHAAIAGSGGPGHPPERAGPASCHARRRVAAGDDRDPRTAARRDARVDRSAPRQPGASPPVLGGAARPQSGPARRICGRPVQGPGQGRARVRRTAAAVTSGRATAA